MYFPRGYLLQNLLLLEELKSATVCPSLVQNFALLIFKLLYTVTIKECFISTVFLKTAFLLHRVKKNIFKNCSQDKGEMKHSVKGNGYWSTTTTATNTALPSS